MNGKIYDGAEKFESDLYNAFTDVMFKYRDYAVNEPSHKAAVKDIMNRIIDRFYEGGADDDYEE